MIVLTRTETGYEPTFHLPPGSTVVGASTVAVGNGYLKHTIFFTPGNVPSPPPPAPGP